jgi:hypothetical protein
MIRKKYSDMTQEEKDKCNNIWEKVLNKFCSADSVGNRPCDNGAPCDRCQYDYGLNQDYKRALHRHGIVIIEEDKKR